MRGRGEDGERREDTALPLPNGDRARPTRRTGAAKRKAILAAGLALGVLLLIGHVFIGPKLPVSYKSPEVSAVMYDGTGGHPLEGVNVQVRWSALRPKFFHGSDLVEFHVATAVTDQNGRFTIPAWGPVTFAKEWRYYDWEPMVSYSKPGYDSGYIDNHNSQESVTPNAWPFTTVTLARPSWHEQPVVLRRSGKER